MLMKNINKNPLVQDEPKGVGLSGSVLSPIAPQPLLAVMELTNNK